LSYLDIIIEAVSGSLTGVFQIALIVIPLMVFIEIISDLNLLEKLTAILAPFTNLVGISPEGRLPIMAGLIFGISYGSGIIINSAREGKLTYRDIYLINLFLVICHAVLEDTILIAAIGAKWFPVLMARFFLAIIICYVVARLMPVPLSEKSESSL
jgi:hypothetical protein